MTVQIGTRLLAIEPYRNARSGPPREYEITGETRLSWVACGLIDDKPRGVEVKIDKATMLERGRMERRTHYMTPAEYEHAGRRAAAEGKILSAVGQWSWERKLTDAQLDAIAAILGVAGYEPLVPS